MNQDFFESQWSQIRLSVRDKWSRLTEEDLNQIDGHYDNFISKLQQRYNISRDQAESEINKWNYEKHTKPYTPMAGGVAAHPREDEKSASGINWLVFAGIPLLLLAGYYLFSTATVPTATPTTPTATAPRTTQEMTAPAVAVPDNTLRDNIRTAFSGNESLAGVVRNLSIDSSNGVVTISGTVPTPQHKEQISRVAERVSGVKQVINKVEVKQ